MIPSYFCPLCEGFVSVEATTRRGRRQGGGFTHVGCGTIVRVSLASTEEELALAAMGGMLVEPDKARTRRTHVSPPLPSTRTGALRRMIYLPPDLAQDLDRLADTLGTTRSGVVVHLLEVATRKIPG